MNELVSTLNGLVWSPALIYLCLGVGLYFSLRGRFLQVRHFKEMIRLMFTGKTDEHGNATNARGRRLVHIALTNSGVDVEFSSRPANTPGCQIGNQSGE